MTPYAIAIAVAVLAAFVVGGILAKSPDPAAPAGAASGPSGKWQIGEKNPAGEPLRNPGSGVSP